MLPSASTSLIVWRRYWSALYVWTLSRPRKSAGDLIACRVDTACAPIASVGGISTERDDATTSEECSACCTADGILRISRSRPSCPACRHPLKAGQVAGYPRNFALEQVVFQLEQAKQGASATRSATAGVAAEEDIHGITQVVAKAVTTTSASNKSLRHRCLVVLMFFMNVC